MDGGDFALRAKSRIVKRNENKTWFMRVFLSDFAV
jgi:hypothetical protein